MQSSDVRQSTSRAITRQRWSQSRSRCAPPRAAGPARSRSGRTEFHAALSCRWPLTSAQRQVHETRVAGVDEAQAVTLRRHLQHGQVLPLTTMVLKKASGFHTGAMSDVACGRNGMFTSVLSAKTATGAQALEEGAVGRVVLGAVGVERLRLDGDRDLAHRVAHRIARGVERCGRVAGLGCRSGQHAREQRRSRRRWRHGSARSRRRRHTRSAGSCPASGRGTTASWWAGRWCTSRSNGPARAQRCVRPSALSKKVPLQSKSSVGRPVWRIPR